MVVLSTAELKNHENQRYIKGLNQITGQTNRISSSSFGHTSVSPTVETALQDGGYIGYLEMDGQVVASGFAEDDTYNSEYKCRTILLHTFSTHENYRGRGLCQKIVGEFIKKFGRNCILYLTVRTEIGNVNESAIKCYEKNGFIMLPSVYRDHYDGKNSAMVRMPILNKSRKTNKRSKKRIKRK
jgi:ribosomal protein S18 acetylase RimI-like enzyme